MTWFLLGVITGIIIGVLIDRDTVYKTVQKIAKIKVKKSSNVSDLIKIAPAALLRQNKRQIKRENRRKAKRNTRTTS